MAVAIVAAFLGTRFAFLRWLDVQDHTYGSLSARHLARAAERFETVLRVCGRLALDPEVWGLLWPVAFVAGVVLAVRGTRTERALAGALWTSVAAYTAIFLFTNWDVELQAVQAYTRLLSQLAPAAIVAIALSYGRVRHAIDLRFPPIPESAALPRGHVGR
jgi:TRAP-type C4-dicarboxylate transport system permease large subunit